MSHRVLCLDGFFKSNGKRVCDYLKLITIKFSICLFASVQMMKLLPLQNKPEDPIAHQFDTSVF